MNISEALDNARKTIIKKKKKLIWRDIFEILSEVTKLEINKIHLYSDEFLLSIDEVKKFNEMIKSYCNNVPLSYIIKRRSFFGINFYVDERVLIPRFETEILVSNVLEFINLFKNKYPNDRIKLFDICTGSGVIGLSIKKNISDIDLYLSDISVDALEVAKINSNLLSIYGLFIYQGNFIDPFLKNNLRANIITINPPYISHADKNLSNDVFLNEPRVSLFAEDDGLFFYKNLLQNYTRIVDIDKYFYIIIEFGFQQKKEIEKLCSQYIKNNSYKFIKDYSNNWRFLILTNF
ncbi:peptide chain release factor N(5)-glutamine methyltransferase [Spiroplasma endosymbiont of Labia minor]|uniref:peptide chain release factor N(5)-glutamine methyltransferase n=1 Tax=Spiroplasma endosymbiont of Labia minor TaxID=3066305 RepID=UPI0030D1CB7E